MEQLKMIKEQLVTQVQAQMGDLKKVNTVELGAVIDMIKDLAKAIYYCTVTEAMEEAHEKEEEYGNYSNNYYYTEKYYPYDYYRDMDYSRGKMYYSEGSNNNSSSSGNNSQSSSQGQQQGSNYYSERNYPWTMRDEREGRSPMKRKMYMESKATSTDSSKTMKELESYMQELTSDMMEMLENSSPEEKAIVQKKINTLAAKVQNV